MVCRFTPLARLTVAPRPESVARARRFVHERCCRRHAAPIVDIAALLVSELVTNTVRYGGPPIVVEIECGPAEDLCVRVSDSGPGVPTLRRTTAADESGRGLQIVDALSDGWGVDPQTDGKTVWFRLTPP